MVEVKEGIIPEAEGGLPRIQHAAEGTFALLEKAIREVEKPGSTAKHVTGYAELLEGTLYRPIRIVGSGQDARTEDVTDRGVKLTMLKFPYPGSFAYGIYRAEIFRGDFMVRCLAENSVIATNEGIEAPKFNPAIFSSDARELYKKE